MKIWLKISSVLLVQTLVACATTPKTTKESMPISPAPVTNQTPVQAPVKKASIDEEKIFNTLRKVQTQLIQLDDLEEQTYAHSLEGNPVLKKKTQKFIKQYGDWETLEISMKILNELAKEAKL
jgi:hypothetical protein